MNKLKIDISSEDLKKFLKELPEENAAVMELFLENKTQKDIAEKLNLSLSVTRQRLSKAKFLLRKLGGHQEYEKAYKLLYGRLPVS